MIGADLSHIMDDGSERPIALASRTLIKAERNYSQIDKEALALVWGAKKFHFYLFGRHFTSVADDEPLTSIFNIFNPRKGIPAMTVARLQRYASFLAGSSTVMSTRTVPNMQTQMDCQAYLLKKCATRRQMEVLPVSADMIGQATQRNPIFSRVMEHTKQGWPAVCEKELKPFYRTEDELTIQDGCLMLGLRVLIPPKHQNKCWTDSLVATLESSK